LFKVFPVTCYYRRTTQQCMSMSCQLDIGSPKLISRKQ